MASYPTHFKDPLWAQLFRDLPVTEVDAACSHWFTQWQTHSVTTSSMDVFNSDVLETMLTFHELSNRVDAKMDQSILLMGNEDEFGGKNALVINAFQSALAPIGWRGIAMRCWTDVKGYAGMLQYLNDSNGVLTLVDDLAMNMAYSLPLFQALDTYPQLFGYPWVQAAVVRAAIDGVQPPGVTELTKHSSFYTWLVQSYGTMSKIQADRFQRTDVGSIVEHPEVNILLDTPEFWLHSLYQECHLMGGVNLYGTTGRLWAHWMTMAGREHPAVPLIAEMSYYRSDTTIIMCGLSGRPNEEASLMELWKSPKDCLVYLLSHPNTDELTLPPELATPY